MLGGQGLGNEQGAVSHNGNKDTLLHFILVITFYRAECNARLLYISLHNRIWLKVRALERMLDRP